MSKLEAKLLANGMRNMAISEVESAFDFIVGDNRYSRFWFLATFLSLGIAALHALNPFICELHVNRRIMNKNLINFFLLGAV
jgi:hypothetical protein